MATPLKTPIVKKTLTIEIPDDLIQQIEDFQFRPDVRAKSRVQAIRLLLMRGLAASAPKKEAK